MTPEQHLPWHTWPSWPLGCRVVLRRRLPEGGYSDVLGDLLACEDGTAVVATRRGEVTVRVDDVVAARRVPPPPPRRAPREAD